MTRNTGRFYFGTAVHWMLQSVFKSRRRLVLLPGSIIESGSSSSLPDIQVDLLPSADVEKTCKSLAPPPKDEDQEQNGS